MVKPPFSSHILASELLQGTLNGPAVQAGRVTDGDGEVGLHGLGRDRRCEAED